MTFVVDASVVAAWFLAETYSAHALRIDPYRVDIGAPQLLLPEIANIGWKHVQRGSLSRADAEDFVARCFATPIELTPHEDLLKSAFALAAELGHPAYDCFYLALALERSCRVVTGDRRLQGRVSRSPYAGLTLWIEDVA